MRASSGDPVDAPSSEVAPPPPPFRTTPQLAIDIETHGHQTVLRVAGEIDPATRAQLEAGFAAVLDATAEVVVDVRGVSFMDSTGLATLLAARERAVAAGGNLVVRDPTPPVERLLAITRLDDVFTIERSARETGAATTAAPCPAPAFEVVNRENGQVIEVRLAAGIDGVLDEAVWAPLEEKLLALVELRQPRELHIEVPPTDANLMQDTSRFENVRAAVTAFGGRLVVGPIPQ